MTDFYDQATEAEERFREEAIAKQAEKAPRRELTPGDWRALSAKWCEGPACGARIPDKRRRAVLGVRLCTSCQAQHEEEERRGR